MIHILYCTGGSHAILYLDLGSLEVKNVVQVSHTGQAWAMDFHPKLAILATGSMSKDVRFWNVSDKRPAVGKILKVEAAPMVRISTGRYCSNPMARPPAALIGLELDVFFVRGFLIDFAALSLHVRAHVSAMPPDQRSSSDHFAAVAPSVGRSVWP